MLVLETWTHINAKAVEWGSPFTDRRGQIVLEWIAAENLTVTNEGGGPPTCKTPNGTSYIDVTLCTETAARMIRGWRVTEDTTLSDHACISFEISARHGTNLRREKRAKSVDTAKFKEMIERDLAETRNRGEVTPEILTRILKRAQEKSSNNQPGARQDVPYWWTEAVNAARCKCPSPEGRGRGIAGEAHRRARRTGCSSAT